MPANKLTSKPKLFYLERAVHNYLLLSEHIPDLQSRLQKYCTTWPLKNNKKEALNEILYF